jgi:hypothetical protein
MDEYVLPYIDSKIDEKLNREDFFSEEEKNVKPIKPNQNFEYKNIVNEKMEEKKTTTEKIEHDDLSW